MGHDITNYIQCVVEGSINLIDDVIRASSDNNGYNRGFRSSLHKQHLVLADCPLLHEFRGAKIVLCEVLNLGYYRRACGLVKSLNV